LPRRKAKLSNADFYKSGEGQTIQPASRNLEEITARELTSTFGAWEYLLAILSKKMMISI
jgi:hypothetical protein